MAEEQTEIVQFTKNEAFKSVEDKMKAAGLTPEEVQKEISFAVQPLNKSKELQKCTHDSIRNSVWNISNIGLSLNPAAKEAYLIPRRNKATEQMECVLEPSYVGLVKLLTDAGSVTSVSAQLVYQKDIFELDLADSVRPIVHKPNLKKTERGEILGAYAIAALPNGSRQAEWMDIEEINDIKGRSESFKAYMSKKIYSCTWVSDFGEMARKTVIKRIFKYLPRTERMDKIDEAIKLDNSDFTASDQQVSYIENLLRTSLLDDRQREFIEMELTVMNSQRAGEVITYLKENQQNVDHRLGSQKEVSEHIKKLR